MKTFHEFVNEKDPDILMESLWVYECPTCMSESYDGDPFSGDLYLGHAKCQKCGFFPVEECKLLSKQGPLVESWLGNFAQDVWGRFTGPDSPASFFNKMFYRVYQKNDDIVSWKQIIKGLRRVGKTQEANALEFALNEGRIEVLTDWDEKMGWYPEQMKFEFHPPRHKVGFNSEDTYSWYKKMWEKYGSPVQVVGQKTYWKGEEKVPVQIYGFWMKHPAREKHGQTWPEDRSREYQQHIDQEQQAAAPSPTDPSPTDPSDNSQTPVNPYIAADQAAVVPGVRRIRRRVSPSERAWQMNRARHV